MTTITLLIHEAASGNQAAVMRSVIVDLVRGRQAEHRGGDLIEITLDTQAAAGLPSGEAEVLQAGQADGNR